MRVSWLVVLAACGSPSHPATDAPALDARALDAALDAVPTPDAPATIDPSAELANLPPLCGPTGWCWLAPRPIGTRWTAAWANSPTNLWLTAAPAYLFHWDGALWHSIDPPVIPPAYRPNFRNDVDIITGSSATDLWMIAATGALAYHFDGAAYTLVASIPAPAQDDGFLSGVWEAPDTDDRWLCADHELFHGHGSGPLDEVVSEPTADPGCGSIWGVAHDDFWITESGVPYHYDGHAFTPSTSPPIGPMVGTAANDIWAIGVKQIVHYDGAAWTTVQATDANALVRVAGGAAPNDVWFVASATAPHAYTLHWDGTAFTRFDQPIVEQPTSTQTTVLDGRLFVPAERGTFYEAAVDPITNPLLHPTLAPNLEGYNQIWPDPDGSFWIAGVGAVYHLVGNEVRFAPTGSTLNVQSIDGVRTNDTLEIIGVGQDGAVHHFDGTTWTATQLAAPWLDGVWVGKQGVALAVGAGGVAFRWDGAAWTPVATGLTTELYAVWGPDPDHAYAVGANGKIVAWSSAAPDVMTPVASPTTTELRAIHGAGGKVWMAGERLWQGDFAAGFTDVSPASGCCSWLFRSVFAVSATEAYAGSQKILYHATGGGPFVDDQLGLDVGTGVFVAISPTGRGLAGTNLGALMVRP